MNIPTRILVPNLQGDDVKSVQTTLQQLGFAIPDGELGTVGPLTQQAVTTFQTKLNLPATGTVDIATAQAMATLASRYAVSAPKLQSKRAQARLLDSESKLPLGGYKVSATIPGPNAAPIDIGSSVTGADGLFSLTVPLQSLPMGLVPTAMSSATFSLTVSDPTGRTVLQTQIQAALGTDVLVDVLVPVTPAPINSPTIAQAAQASALQLPQDLFAFLAQRKINTLDDVSKAGGLRQIAGIPGGAQSQVLATLDAHADLIRVTNDVNANASLIGAGFLNTKQIADTQRSPFVTKVGPSVSDFTAAQIHLIAQAHQKIVYHIIGGLAVSQVKGQPTPDAEGILQTQCSCKDCEAAMSPLAYLADLCAYVVQHVTLEGATLSLPLLRQTFYQPFDQLPITCAAMNTQVRQVRLAVEILRQYIAVTLPTPTQAAALAIVEKAYRAATYEELLTQMGTSYSELRLSRIADAATRQSLADKLGILLGSATRPDNLDTLFLDPQADAPDPLAVTEALIESLFGFVDTTRDPLVDGPVPLVETWQSAKLLSDWTIADHPTDPTINPSVPVIIDPDLIGPADFVNPVSTDPAFALYQTRQTWVATQLATLQANPQTLAGLQASTATATGSTLDALAALAVQDATGADISSNLSALFLTRAAFFELLSLRTVLMGSLPALTSEWVDANNILIQVMKQKMIPQWQTEEKTQSIVLGPDSFEIPASTVPAVPLIEWRADSDDRQNWQDVLQSRIDERQTAQNALATAVSQVESDQLPSLRDALVSATDAEGDSFELMNRWLSKRLLIDTQAGGCQITTRVSLAIDTLQNLVFSLSNGQFKPYGEWGLIGDIAVDQFQSSVTTLVRTPTHIDLFVVQKNGGIYSSSWEGDVDQPEWTPWYGISIPSFTVPADSVITAVARDASHMDIFVVGTEGAIWTSSWDGTAVAPAWSAWNAIGNASTNHVALKSQLPVVSRDANHMDLFCIGTDNNLYQAQWDGTAATPAWSGWAQVPAAGLTFVQGAVFSAVSRDAQHIDLFCAGTLGGTFAVYTTTWDGTAATPAWSDWTAINAGVLGLSSGVAVTAVCRDAQHMDIFLVATNSQGYNASWDGTAATPGWSTYVPVGPSNGSANAVVTPVARDSMHLTVFMAGSDGVPYRSDKDFTAATPAWSAAQPIGDPSIHKVPVPSVISAALLNPQEIELFTLGSDNGVYTAPWNLQDWALDDDNYDEQWKWLGSYATWRSAMLVFLYPENILMPSLKRPTSGTFSQIMSNLRSEQNLQPSDVCQAGAQYSDFFQDMCSLMLAASCESMTLIHNPVEKGCADPTATVYRPLFYMFAAGKHSGTNYFSVVDPGGDPTYQQTFWEPIPGIPNQAAIVGSAVYGTQGYTHLINVFYKTYTGSTPALAYVQYDLEGQRWTGTPISLDVPDSPTDFSIAVKQTEVEHEPPHLMLLVGWKLFQRTLNDQATGWAAGDWKALNDWSNPDPVYPWTDPTVLFGMNYLYSMVAEGGSSNSFYFTVSSQYGDLWVIYLNAGWIGNTPDELIPKVMLSYNFGLVNGYQGGGFWTNSFDMIITLSSPVARYAVAVNDKWTALNITPLNYEGANIVYIAPLTGSDPDSWKTLTRRYAYQSPTGPVQALFLRTGNYISESQTRFISPQVAGPYLLTDNLSTSDLRVRAGQIETAMLANQWQDGTITALIQEMYYLLPMQFGYWLWQQGSYQEALSWYRTVYDYTQPESTRIIYYGLEVEKHLPNTYSLFPNWLLDPLNPHAIAATRQLTYTRYTLQQIILCLLAYADSEYTQDTSESVELARTLYLIALSLMDSQALMQSLNGCSDMIGDLEIDITPEWGVILPKMKDQLMQIRNRYDLSTALSNVKSTMSQKNVPIDARFAQVQKMLNDTLAKTTKATMQTVFDTQDNVFAQASTLLIKRQPALGDALSQVTQIAGSHYSRAVSKVTQIPEESLTKVSLPFLKLPNRAPSTTLQAPPSVPQAPSVPARAVDSSAHAQLMNVQRLNSATTPTPNVQSQMMAESFKFVTKKVSNIDLINIVGNVPVYTPAPVMYFFCVPPNPVLLSLRLRAELNLYKLRSCRNIAGLQRALDPYSAPTDETSGLPSIGAGGQLILPGATTIKPTPYRYSVLLDRAKQLVQLASQQEASMLSALEKADAESYTLLKAQQDMSLAQAQVQLSSLQVTQAQDGVTLASDQRDRAQIQVDRYDKWIQQGVSQMEQDALDALGDAVDLSNVASDLQIAAAGVSTGAGVADMVASFGLLGGGDVAQGLSSLAGSMSSRAQAKQLASSQEAMQASFERRQDEWELDRDLAQQDVKIGDQQITIAQDGVAVAAQTYQIASLTADNAAATVNFLNNKFTNIELYDWMSGVLEGVYSYLLQQATATAQMASNQLAFERQETPPPFIQSDYWQTPSTSSTTSISTSSTPTDRRGLTGAERLLQDIEQLDQYAFNTDQRKLQLTKAISVAQLAPLEFQEFKQSGVLSFATPSSLFDRDFPGHYLRLINQVRVSVIALVPPLQGIKATLTCTGVSRVVVEGELFSTMVVRHDPEEIALTAPLNATGIFPLDPQSDMTLPFESLGVDTQWEFEMPRAANFIDYSTIADVVLSIDYTALSDDDYRTQVLQTMSPIFSGERPYSFEDALADAWYDLNNPDQSATPMTVKWTTTAQDFPANLTDVRIQQVVLYFQRADGVVTEIPVDHLTFTPASGGPAIGGGSTTVGGVISTRRGNGSAWLPMIGQVPYGTWELALPNTKAVTDLFTNSQIEDILFDITYSGRTPAWPA